MKRLLLAISIIFISANSFASSGIPNSRDWVPAGFGGGGRYQAMIPDNTTAGKLYMISDVASPWVTMDRGDNWSFMANVGYSNDSSASITQSENNPLLLYTIGTACINKSTDGGATWTNVGSYKATKGSVYKSIIIDRSNDDIVYAGLDNGQIIKTIDGGVTWTTLFTPFGVNVKPAFVWINADSTKLFVGGNSSGLISYDLNSNIATTVTLSGTNSNYNYDYGTYTDGSSVEHFCTTAGLKIACTIDNGANWTYTAAVTTGTTYIISKFAVRYKSAGTVTIILSRRLISNQASTVQQRSIDGGITWLTGFTNTKNIPESPPSLWKPASSPNMTGMSSDPFDENTFYYHTDWSFWKSTDSGATWNEKVKGAQIQVLTDISISANGTIFTCGMDVGCQYSTDHGTSWTEAIPTASMGSAKGGHYWRVKTTGSADDWNAGNGHVIVSSNWWADFKPRIARSIDNGVTWTFISDGFPNYNLTGDTIWDQGYLRSMGKSSDEQTLYVGIDGSRGSFNEIAKGGVFKSTDNGQSWARTSTPSSYKIYNGIAVDPTDSSGNTLIYGNFGYNSYRSTNGGASYSYTGGLFYVYDLAFDSVGHPYSVGTDSGPVIYKSVVTPYGAGTGSFGTWELMHRFEPTTQTSGIADGLLVDPSNDNRIFCGWTLGPTGKRKIYVTADAQHHTTSTWTNITGDLGAIGGVQAMAIDYSEGAKGFLYAVTNGSGVWKLDLDDTPASQANTVKLGGDY